MTRAMTSLEARRELGAFWFLDFPAEREVNEYTQFVEIELELSEFRGEVNYDA